MTGKLYAISLLNACFSLLPLTTPVHVQDLYIDRKVVTQTWSKPDYPVYVPTVLHCTTSGPSYCFNNLIYNIIAREHLLSWMLFAWRFYIHI
jgi:hypothetical protein